MSQRDKGGGTGISIGVADGQLQAVDRVPIERSKTLRPLPLDASSR
jgi:hypothetical protein